MQETIWYVSVILTGAMAFVFAVTRLSELASICLSFAVMGLAIAGAIDGAKKRRLP